MARLTSSSSFLNLWSLVLSVSLINTVAGNSLGKTGTSFFIFGDSTVDPGNNNFINTAPENRADYEPYGQNGFFKKPTGRFSDGRVIVDFIAEYAKLPLIPPYMQPSTDYSSGVNFASGGAGVLSETNQGIVIDLRTQLKNFEQAEKSLGEKLGDVEAKRLISEAVYFISIGSNDYMKGYLGNPKMQELYLPEAYIGMVIGNLTQSIQLLYEKGARKFGFLSLSPLGCLPALRALNPEGSCFEAANGLAMAHNNAVKALLPTLQHMLPGFSYCNPEFYNWLHDRINNPSTYGFKDGVNACCGSGPFAGIFSCGAMKKLGDYQLCNNPQDHVWWDSFHASERIHQQFGEVFWEDIQNFFFYNQETTKIADSLDVPVNEQYYSVAV